MSQKQKILDLEDTIRLIDAVVMKHLRLGRNINWRIEPPEVVMLLAKTAVNIDGRYVITYNKASDILMKATSSKLTPSFNRGLGEIREALKKRYIGEI